MNKIQWHPGFYSGLEWELREYRDSLEFLTEYELSRKPLRMDMLIIKKAEGVFIDKTIAHIFRQHNIIEYKSPDDELSIDDYYKVLAYAFLYKSFGHKTNEIPAEELTVSIFRHRYPRELIESLKKAGANVEQVYSGVYRVEGLDSIPVQLVVTKQLEDKQYNALKILTQNIKETDFENFIHESLTDYTQGDYNNYEAILDVSISANPELIEKFKEACNMGIFRDYLDEQYKEQQQIGADKGKAELIRNVMRINKISAEKAMKMVGIPAKDFSKYMTML